MNSYLHAKDPKKKTSSNRGGGRCSLCRSLPLLLLTIYAASCVLRLASPPTPTSPPDSLQNKAVLFIAETSRDSESLRTHIRLDKDHLQADQEGSSDARPLPSCADLVRGRADGSMVARSGEGFLCCDRSHYRADVCYAKGDVRTDARTSSVHVFGVRLGGTAPERIRPYTRKFDADVTSTIKEITIRPGAPAGNGSQLGCDVRHAAPGILFSNGGYTGNLYHEFSDGLVPLYITAERFKGEVVLVAAEYHPWWLVKYQSVVRRLSKYDVVNFSAKDPRVHCFSELIVGFQVHGEMLVDPKLMANGNTIQDFRHLLSEGFSSKQPNQKNALPKLPPLLPATRHDDSTSSPQCATRPKLAVFTRKVSRKLTNLRDVVRACRRIGFDVQVINPTRGTPLDEIRDALDSADAMLAVHGAAMTHFVFMRPGAVLLQIVPLGLDWPGNEFYGEPARRLGLQYVSYNITPKESSLYRTYSREDPVLANPSEVTSKGWPEMKKIYLDSQNVKVSIKKLSRLLADAHAYVCSGARLLHADV